jgi:hypothetical protein
LVTFFSSSSLSSCISKVLDGAPISAMLLLGNRGDGKKLLLSCNDSPKNGA